MHSHLYIEPSEEQKQADALALQAKLELRKHRDQSVTLAPVGVWKIAAGVFLGNLLSGLFAAGIYGMFFAR